MTDLLYNNISPRLQMAELDSNTINIQIQVNSLIRKKQLFKHVYWHAPFCGKTISLFLSWINMVFEDFILAETHIILLSFRKLTFWLLLHNIYDFIWLPSDA